MFKILATIAILFLTTSAKTLPAFTGVTSSFKVMTAPTGCITGSDQKAGLNGKGFTKFVCPFGMMIAGVSTMPDSMLLFAANVLATLLDRN